jgi:protein SCO1/2
LAIVTAVVAAPVGAAPSVLEAPKEVSAESMSSGVGLIPHIGAQLPLEADFRDDRGAKVALGDYFGSTPVVVALVYYNCPNLCIVTLDALADRLRTLDLRAGKDFRVVAVGIDPHEGAKEAATARVRILSRYARCGAARSEECRDGWRFLTGQRSSIDAVANTVGFSYVRDVATAQYLHPIAIVVATPRGRVSHYFTNVDLPADALRDALAQAADEHVTSYVDRFWLLCDHYREAVANSGFAVNAVRLTALVVLVALVLLVIRLRRRAS